MRTKQDSEKPVSLMLPEGTGYYLTSTGYQIGGCFRRAAVDMPIVSIIREFAQCHGCNAEVRFADGTTGGTDLSHLKPRN